MASFVWSDKYRLGIKEIDDQHQVLVRIINELDTLMHGDFNRGQLKRLFAELVDYTRYHFSSEERLMKQHGYPRPLLNAHLKQHYQFISEIQAVDNEIETILMEDALVVQDYLNNWLCNHIMKVDKDLVNYIQQYRGDADPEVNLQQSLFAVEKCYAALGATLDSLRTSPQGSTDAELPSSQELINELQDDLSYVSKLLEKALDRANEARNRLDTEPPGEE